MLASLRCRSCGANIDTVFVDLGMSPISNALIPEAESDAPVRLYPLTVYVCQQCKLVQLPGLQRPDELFTDDYVYFSSYSESWQRHAERYTEAMIKRLSLGERDNVVEIGSNDGYLLQFFKARGIGVLGVEPSKSVADMAERVRGIPCLQAFFGRATATRMITAQYKKANLLVATNVLAHVPDINDFVSGFKILLDAEGVATYEFPHLLNLINDTQFDTIYHEHYSYLSFLAVESVLKRNGLAVIDVEEIPTHGGSLRVFAAHAGSRHAVTENVARLRAKETAAGLHAMDIYRAFGKKVVAQKCAILRFFLKCHEEGKTVAGYGAPAKATTLLNYCGIGAEFLPYTVDRGPAKQGRIIPGTGIRIRDPQEIFVHKPDYVVIFPWNLREEISAQMAGIRDWGGRFVVLSPKVEVFQ
ncbi:MAG: methyltransferase domain-containing protein [Betaproteobacteria bacterium]|nr:methyltransferase domain-containing protein [Betaproteobacteria bacterium]